jgi:arylformamidase
MEKFSSQLLRLRQFRCQCGRERLCLWWHLYHVKFAFFKNTTCIDEQVAQLLIQKKVKIVGVDSMSVDHLDNHRLSIHNMLLQQGILIVENLFLEDVPCGQGFVVIAPLKLGNIDGAPARVIMWVG